MTRSLRFPALLLSLSMVALTACSSPDADKQLASSAGTSFPIPLIPGEAHGKDFVPLAEPLPVVSPEKLPVKKAPETLEERVVRLEHTVKTLRADYEKMMPAFAALNVNNDRIAALLAALEKQNGQAVPVQKVAAEQGTSAKAKTITPVTKPGRGSSISSKKEDRKPQAKVSLTKVPSKAAVLKEKPKGSRHAAAKPPEVKQADSKETVKGMAANASSPAGSNAVSRLRLGEHNGKTRLVLDLKSNSKPSFQADLDNVEKLLLIDLPGTEWVGGESAKTPKSAFVAGWSVQKTPSGGSSLAIQLKAEAKIKTSQFLPAEGKDPARLVLDIGPNKK